MISPQPLSPLFSPPTSNFDNFGPIWMKLGGVQNDGVIVYQHMAWLGVRLAHPETTPKTNFGNYGPIWMKLGGEV